MDETIVENLVSVIVPCYNMADKVERLIRSLLNQTYQDLEVIFVNDGSKDNTKEVILRYKDDFERRGMKFCLIDQENKGLAGAINAGLKAFSGEYLCWPDADDYLEPESIELRVRAFQEHPEAGVVSSDAFLRDESNLEEVTGLISEHYPHSNEPKQFQLLLDEKSMFCAGCHLVRTNAFLEVNPERYIYPAKRGQNWQMLLPLYYKYSRFFLDRPLYNYINYSKSMSKNKDNLDNLIERYKEHEQIIIKTLSDIERTQHVDLKDEKNRIEIKTIRNIFYAAGRYGDKECHREYYRLLKKYRMVTMKDRLRFIIREVGLWMKK